MLRKIAKYKLLF